MRLPEIAAELRLLSEQLGVPRLAELADAMKRRKRAPRSKTQSTPMTPELAEQIHALRKQHPRWSQSRIAAHLNISQGRVSETLVGKRT